MLSCVKQMARDLNPFTISGELRSGEMIDREEEAARLLALAEGGHWVRLQAPRRYGKTTLLRRTLDDAARAGMATALVDFEGVVSMGSVVVRIERAYARGLRGRTRRAVESFLRSWDLGVSLSGPGFAASLRANPRIDTEVVLLRLLEVPARIAERDGTRTVVAFDEFQDLLKVEGADGVLRSVIQHQGREASYVFSGSAPSLMRRLFDDPSRPLLEQAIPLELGPLPLDATAAAIEERFGRTGRDAGDALTPLVSFARGHPQRTMLLAHHLWELTPRGGVADEPAWVEAADRAVRAAQPALRARWEGLPLNEQRVALALATAPGSVYEEAAYATVGLKRGSIRAALDGLEGRGEVMRGPGGVQLVDPLLERWLAERGL